MPSDSDTEGETESDDKTASGGNSLRTKRESNEEIDDEDPFQINFDDLTSSSVSKSSFPSIHFGNSAESSKNGDSDSDDESSSDEEGEDRPIFTLDVLDTDGSTPGTVSPRPLARTLYIQMVR